MGRLFIGAKTVAPGTVSSSARDVINERVDRPVTTKKDLQIKRTTGAGTAASNPFLPLGTRPIALVFRPPVSVFTPQLMDRRVEAPSRAQPHWSAC
jgi:hypothetical protein